MSHKTVGKIATVPVRAGGAPLPAGGGVALEVLDLRPYLANHWYEYWFDDEHEAPGQDLMFVPGFYLANGRCWLQGVISWWPTGGVADGDFDKNFESGLIFTGLPARYCPPGPTTVRFYVDTVNSSEQWLLTYTWFDGTVTPDGSCTVASRGPTPRLPCGASNDLYLCLDTISWPVSGPMEPVADTLDLDPYQQVGEITAVDPHLDQRGAQIFGGGTAATIGGDNLWRDNIFNDIENAPPAFFPYAVTDLPQLARKVPIPSVDGNGYLTTHAEAAFQLWAWSAANHYQPGYFFNTAFLSDFMQTPTALDNTPSSLTGAQHWYGIDPVYIDSPYTTSGDWLAAGCTASSMTVVRPSVQCRFGINGDAALLDAIELHLGYGPYDTPPDWAGEAYKYAAAFGRWIYYHNPLVPASLEYWTFEMGIATWTLAGVRTDHVLSRFGPPTVGDEYRLQANHDGRATFLKLEAWKNPEPNPLFHIRMQHGYRLGDQTTATFGIGLNPFYSTGGGYQQLPENSHGLAIWATAQSLYFDWDARIETADFEFSRRRSTSTSRTPSGRPSRRRRSSPARPRPGPRRRASCAARP